MTAPMIQCGIQDNTDLINVIHTCAVVDRHAVLVATAARRQRPSHNEWTPIDTLVPRAQALALPILRLAGSRFGRSNRQQSRSVGVAPSKMANNRPGARSPLRRTAMTSRRRC
jgi:hypothetical protein